MQQLRLLLLVAFSTLLFTNCKKESTGNNQPPTETKGEKIKREHGQPNGIATKTFIGNSGGSITSADGRITVTVPAGAVEVATEFSIQPVTNTLKTRGLAYRLLPEGISFKKEVSISYSYAGVPLLVADSKYLFLTYQDAEGYYHEARNTQNNGAAQKLTVGTKHFSDWTFFSRIEMETDRTLLNGTAYMKKNEAMRLEIHTYKAAAEDGASSEPVLEEYIFNPGVMKAAWSLTKPRGAITPLPLLDIADYKAPADIPQQETLMIHATLTGNFGTDNLGQPVKQLILGQDVVLEPEDDEYFYLSADGTDHSLQQLTAVYIPGWINIGGYTSANHSIAIYLFTSGTGTFAYGQPGQNNKASIEYLLTPSEGYMSYKPVTCSFGGGLTMSSGSVRLTKIAQNIGEYTEGDFTAGLYRTNYCNNPGSKDISGRFKIKKRF